MNTAATYYNTFKTIADSSMSSLVTTVGNHWLATVLIVSAIAIIVLAILKKNTAHNNESSNSHDRLINPPSPATQRAPPPSSLLTQRVTPNILHETPPSSTKPITPSPSFHAQNRIAICLDFVSHPTHEHKEMVIKILEETPDLLANNLALLHAIHYVSIEKLESYEFLSYVSKRMRYDIGQARMNISPGNEKEARRLEDLYILEFQEHSMIFLAFISNIYSTARKNLTIEPSSNFIEKAIALNLITKEQLDQVIIPGKEEDISKYEIELIEKLKNPETSKTEKDSILQSIAMSDCDREMVKKTIEAGIDFSSIPNLGNQGECNIFLNTPLLTAIVNGINSNAATILHYAPDCAINHQCISKNTALHLAVAKGYEKRNDSQFVLSVSNADLVDLLLKKGANPNIQNNNGDTPLHFAYARRDQKMIDLLERAGADKTIQNKKGKIPTDLGHLNYKEALEFIKETISPIFINPTFFL